MPPFGSCRLFYEQDGDERTMTFVQIEKLSAFGVYLMAQSNSSCCAASWGLEV